MLAVPLRAAIIALQMAGITKKCRTVSRIDACLPAVITSCKPQLREVVIVVMTSSSAELAANACLPSLT